MPRNILNLAVLVCIAVPNSGHSASVAGVWEATEKPNEYAEHHVLGLDESGLYEYVILSDDPQNPLRSDSGSFSQIDDEIILFSTDGVQLADTLYYSADGSTLLNRTFSIEFAPGRKFDGDIHDTWEFYDLDGQPTGGTITLFRTGHLKLISALAMRQDGLSLQALRRFISRRKLATQSYLGSQGFGPT